MRPTSWHGPIAVIVVEVDGPSLPAEGESAVRSVVAALRELAERFHGTVTVPDGVGHVVVVSSVPRAVTCALAVADQLRSVRARIGVDVGELAGAEPGSRDAVVRAARELAAAAEPSQVLVSEVVRDILTSSGGPDTVELADPTPASERGPRFALIRPPEVTAVSGSVGPPQRLVDRLEELVLGHRLTLVTGRAGVGKTTLARAVSTHHPTVWITPPAAGVRAAVFARSLVDGLRIRVPGVPATLTELAGGLVADDPDDQIARAETLATTVAGALTDLLPRDLLVVVDGVDGLPAAPLCLALLEALARNAPPGMRLLLIGRRDPGLRTERLAESGDVATLDGADLWLTDAEVGGLASALLGGEPAPEDVSRVVAVAHGHPETAALASAVVRRRREPVLENAVTLAREVVDLRDDVQRSVLTALAALRAATPSLLEELTGLPVEDPLRELRRDGLIRLVGDGQETFEVGAAASSILDVPDVDRHRLGVAAAQSLRARGEAAAALELLRSVGARDRTLGVLREEGRRLLRDHGWPAVLEAVGDDADDPHLLFGDGEPDAGDAELAGLIGEAWRLAGDRTRALAWFEYATDAVELVPPWLAWRMGVLLHFAGELDAARELYARAGSDGEASDRSLVHAWSGAAAWMQSDIETCRAEAAVAVDLARSSHDDRALAAAHTVQALLAAIDGDRAANDQHYLRGLEHAERAGDVLQLVRIRVNRGSRLLEEGDHAASLAELDLALETADLTGAMPVHGMALSNRGQALRRLGRLDEATADLVASRRVFERTGSRWVAYALAHLGDIYRIRGERALALSCYEEAIAQSEPVGDVQGLVPALTGMALHCLPGDVDRAEELIERACRYPASLGYTMALAVRAYVAAAKGDVRAAMAHSDEGLAVARRRRDRPGLAMHLELRARVTSDAAAARADLREALSLWRRMQCPLDAARVEAELAARDTDPDSEAVAEAAIRTMRAHGARAWADAAEAGLASHREDTAPPVRVRVLGGFVIEHVGGSAAQGATVDRDVRDLLAYLAANDERPSSSSAAAAALWPDEDDAADRLAVARAGLRDLLSDVADVAPSGATSDEAFELELDPTVVHTDLWTFRRETERGLAGIREGLDDDAERHLQAAEAAYAGPFLDGHGMAPWMVVVRDDLAEAYLQVVSALIDLAEARGESHAAVRLLLRVIERDPYDEGAHLRLIACLERAGRRGESRRRYRNYVAHMRDIGVEPASFPAERDR